jgi:hypothetical protein
MTNRTGVLAGSLIVLIIGAIGGASGAEEKAPANSVPVRIVATVEALQEDTRVSVLKREDVQVRQGKNSLSVTGWTPTRGEQAGLQLFILLDETSGPNLGLQFPDLRAFIQAQPATTSIALGYMRNSSVKIQQNFTTDHAQAAKALRLPLGGVGASDSPYLSLIGLMKGWPDQKVRREVLLITDGIDRVHGYNTPARNWSRFRYLTRAMPYISPDVDQASQDAQRYGIIVHAIYTPGVGHAGRNYYEATSGQNGLAKLADETGGESFYLGLQNAVSFKPYLDTLQNILDNQYVLEFRAAPGPASGLQPVRISTEVPGVEIVTADNVWVPIASQAAKPN